MGETDNSGGWGVSAREASRQETRGFPCGLRGLAIAVGLSRVEEQDLLSHFPPPRGRLPNLELLVLLLHPDIFGLPLRRCAPNTRLLPTWDF